MTYAPAANATPVITSKPSQKPQALACERFVTAPRPYLKRKYNMITPTIMTGIEMMLNGVSHGPRGFISESTNRTKRPNSPLTLTSLFIAVPLYWQSLIQHRLRLQSQTLRRYSAYCHLKVR